MHAINTAHSGALHKGSCALCFGLQRIILGQNVLYDGAKAIFGARNLP